MVQKALETLDETDLPRLLTEFHNNVLSCIHDQNGNHVIQKCLSEMNYAASQTSHMFVPAAIFDIDECSIFESIMLGNSSWSSPESWELRQSIKRRLESHIHLGCGFGNW